MILEYLLTTCQKCGLVPHVVLVEWTSRKRINGEIIKENIAGYLVGYLVNILLDIVLRLESFKLTTNNNQEMKYDKEKSGLQM
jgi:hypothetical protein